MAGIKAALAPQGREQGVIQPAAFALAQHRAIPTQAQPLQISDGLRLCPRPVAGRIEIIDAQEPFSSCQSSR